MCWVEGGVNSLVAQVREGVAFTMLHQKPKMLLAFGTCTIFKRKEPMIFLQRFHATVRYELVLVEACVHSFLQSSLLGGHGTRMASLLIIKKNLENVVYGSVVRTWNTPHATVYSTVLLTGLWPKIGTIIWRTKQWSCFAFQ